MKKGLICCAIYPGASAAVFTFNCYPLLSASGPQRARSEALYSCTNKAPLSSPLPNSSTWVISLLLGPSLAALHSTPVLCLMWGTSESCLALSSLYLTEAHVCGRGFPRLGDATPAVWLTEASKYLKLVIIPKVQVKSKWLPCTRPRQVYHLLSDNMLHLHAASYVVGVVGKCLFPSSCSSSILPGTQDADVNSGPYLRLLCQWPFPPMVP